MKLQEVKKILRSGKYAWPGGHPLYFVMADGEPMSFEAVRAEWREICRAHIRGFNADWLIVGVDTNWEDPALLCAHTNERIESAYAEDDAAE